MSNLKRSLLIGWVLIFGLVACAPRGVQEQVRSEEAADVPATSEPFPDALESPASPTDQPEFQTRRDYDELEIVTLLPRDGIPAIDDPKFLSADEADEEYAPDELVIGVNYEGDARAYSIPYLSGHEIVNDTVGGRKIAVTW
jgi:hypothetical protein